MKQDTIAAIASGLTQAGIGIIRISGEDAVTVADRVFRMKKGKLAEQPTHTIHYGFAYDEAEKLDEVIAALMRGPHSFTAEDVVELQCHGGPLVMRKLLQAVLKSGARLAEPGEFSRRAFLNGRMDLSQAEAVMQLIQSRNDSAARNSIQQISGSLSQKIHGIRSEILEEMAFIEAALDDPEHISLDHYGENLEPKINSIQMEVRSLIRTAKEGRWISEGIKTVILGRPNAGKSSLLNQLLGEERAIVTDIAGTTRDILEEAISFGGFSLRLVDTAGIRKTDDKVEKIGVERAKKQAEQADLLIYVVDSSEQLNEDDWEIISMLRGRKALVLMNKIDLESAVVEKELENLTELPVLPVSAKDGTGMDLLKKEIETLFDLGRIGGEEMITITNMRHKEALQEADQSLSMVKQSLEAGMPEDFLTIDLMDAYRALGKITGEEVEEDLINEIFAKFCLGK